mmetsp:Transcript_5984/g.20388  ORF Transcript_5984/g.20388 Transcript_5984/m.20388 type:complete len:234 (+) Transcript_5984:2001-2702(+)
MTTRAPGSSTPLSASSCVKSAVPRKFTPNAASKPSAVRRPDKGTRPALLTSACARTPAAARASAARSMAPKLERSKPPKSCRSAGGAPSSAAAPSPRSQRRASLACDSAAALTAPSSPALRCGSTTRAPPTTKCPTMPVPRPEVPPVTITVRPAASLPTCSLSANDRIASRLRARTAYAWSRSAGVLEPFLSQVGRGCPAPVHRGTSAAARATATTATAAARRIAIRPRGREL